MQIQLILTIITEVTTFRALQASFGLCGISNSALLFTQLIE
jgi:hypothetical protein